MALLSSRPFRSVHLETEGGHALVVKRLHDPHPLRALLDGARARREFEALAALTRAGLAVPRPLDLRRRGRAIELCMQALGDTRTLATLLCADDPPPGGWERLLVELGRLLARLQTTGWRHGDLHPGNVLVDGSGRPWLVDFQRACHAAPQASTCLDEAIECAAATRERLPARLRLRFLTAWRAELAAHLRPTLAGLELARVVESRARERRLGLVLRGLGRWLRDSSRVRVEGRVLLRRDHAAVASGSSEDGLVVTGSREEVLAHWLGAARLEEHGIAAARPTRLELGSHFGRAKSHAVFAPPSARPGSLPLRAALEDRGLGLTHARLAPAGDYLLPPREPQDFRA